MAAQGTTPTQIRLTDEDLDRIERIRVNFGLPSRAAAVRYAVVRACEALDRDAPKKPKKSRATG